MIRSRELAAELERKNRTPWVFRLLHILIGTGMLLGLDLENPPALLLYGLP
jgi:hypothetical protein